MPPLTAQQIQYYQQNGYIIVDTGIDHSILDNIIADLQGVWGNKDITSLPVVHSNRIQDGWKISEKIHHIATQKPVMDILQALYKAKPLPFQTLNFRRGTEQSIHSDSMHFNSEPFGMMCGVWVAMEDIGPDQGPLIFYPGSNQWQEQNFPEAGLEAGDFKNYQPILNQRIADSGIEPSYGTLKKGQALIWAANLIHGGSKQNDKALTRYSQVTHYYFEDCKYWRPTQSKEERRYFSPDWIPLDKYKQKKQNLLSRLGSLFGNK